MDGTGTFGSNSNFVNWVDIIDSYQDFDYEVLDTEGDEETNTNPTCDESVLTLLERLFRVLEDIQFNVCRY
jgi:hypothetical protein